MADKVRAARASVVTKASNMLTGSSDGSSKTYMRKGVFPFLKLPCEIRDKIYDEVLLARLSAEEQERYEKFKSTDRVPGGEYVRENVVDHFDMEMGIMPGMIGPPGNDTVVQARGLFCVNKQVHGEACDTFYGKNIFMIQPEIERVHSFWRTKSTLTVPLTMPDCISPENAAKIKHIFILVDNPRRWDDPQLAKESANLKKNVETVVQCLLHVRTKLETLKVQYTTFFGGEIESVRDQLEDPIEPGMPTRTVMIKGRNGRYHNFSREQADTLVFTHYKLLDPLRKLKGIAQEVRFRGDAPGWYLREMESILSSTNISAATKKKQEKEKAARAQRLEKDRNSGLHGFARKMLQKETDQEMRKTLEGLLRSSKKSPSVLAEMCRPPTKEEIDRISRQVREDRRAGQAVEAQSEDEDENLPPSPVAFGGVGTINGKPVFGPARPPV